MVAKRCSKMSKKGEKMMRAMIRHSVAHFTAFTLAPGNAIRSSSCKHVKPCSLFFVILGFDNLLPPKRRLLGPARPGSSTGRMPSVGRIYTALLTSQMTRAAHVDFYNRLRRMQSDAFPRVVCGWRRDCSP